MKKKILVTAICLMLLPLAHNRWGYTENCVLCKGAPYHEPCVINLSSGDIIPLTVYDPHPFVAGELAEYQRGGFISLIHYSGFSGYRCTDPWETVGTIQPCASAPLWRAFCHSCRKALRQFSQAGFVIADLQNCSNPKFFPLEDNASYSFRCYDISVTLESQENKYRVVVQGTLE